MWGKDEEQYFLYPLESKDDLHKLKMFMNRKENEFFDIIRDKYPSPQDIGGNNAFFLRALRAKMPQSFMSVQEAAKLNEYFVKLQEANMRGNFNDSQQAQICNVVKREMEN